jgi:hypothetical protein
LASETPIAQLEQVTGFEPRSDRKAKLDTLILLNPTSKNLPRDVKPMAELMGGQRTTNIRRCPQQEREMPLTTRRDQLASVAAQPAT